jgi:hypothetical protein
MACSRHKKLWSLRQYMFDGSALLQRRLLHAENGLPGRVLLWIDLRRVRWNHFVRYLHRVREEVFRRIRDMAMVRPNVHR